MSAQPALAQSASQITPPTYAPEAKAPEKLIELPSSASASAPDGADQLSVTLADIAVEGASLDARQLEALRGALVGRTVTVSAIFQAAQALENSFAANGQALMRVIVPAQRIVDGATLRLSVVEGFIEQVDTSAVPARVRGRVDRLLASLVGQKRIDLAAIERKLLLASDTPGLSLRSALAPGSSLGATVLIVEGKHQPLSGFVSFSNGLSEGLGRNSVGLGIDANALLGLGEQIYLRINGLPNMGGERDVFSAAPRNRALAAGLNMPLGNDGLSLNLEAAETRATPKHARNQPGLGSIFSRQTVRLSYPFVRSRSMTLTSHLGLELQEERSDIIVPVVLPLSFDKQRSLRGGGSLVTFLPANGTLYVRSELSLGLKGLGARTAADATPLLPLSRQGADASYESLTFDVNLLQPIDQTFSINWSARGQTAFGGVLTNAEQFGVATSDGVSPLPTGSVQGDSGFVTRYEVRMRLPLVSQGVYANLTPYLFGAAAKTFVEQPTALERGSESARGYGIGARLLAAEQSGLPGLSISAEYGRATKSGLQREADRFTFSIVGQF